jgi:hypothetical protein
MKFREFIIDTGTLISNGFGSAENLYIMFGMLVKLNDLHSAVIQQDLSVICAPCNQPYPCLTIRTVSQELELRGD